MKTNIHRHLLGIYSVLRARIDLVNASIGHAATQGAETEDEIRKLLLDFLPSNYGIGSGIIIDTDGVSTKQIDIIIFDKNRADYSLSKSSKIFFADHVIAAIEIKTTFTSGKNSSLEQSLENIASVKKLQMCKNTWIETNFNTHENRFEFVQYQPTPPLGIIFLAHD